MKRMKSIMAVVFVLCALQASAQVVISQVLYDPIKTESGGEAIEFKNLGTESIDISGWVIETDSAAKDAIVPQGTVLDGGSSFLIADEGWTDGKDKVEWRAADYEEKITLGNQNSGVALLDANGDLIDALGWGNVSDKKLFTGTPAKMVATGKALLRIQNTKDNSKDFVETIADFEEGIAVPVSAEIVRSRPRIEVSRSLTLSPEGMLSIKNTGSVSARVRIVLNDLVFRNLTISKNAVSIDGESEFVVGPSENHQVKVTLNAPSGAIPGTYTSTLRVVTLSGS